MEKERLYINFNEEDFINDEYFQNWAWGRCDQNTNSFWQKFLESHPAKRTEAEYALLVLQAIPFEKELRGTEPTEEQVKKAFLETRRRLGLKESKSSKGRVVAIQRRWWAAAAVLFIMLSGGYFLLRNNTSQSSHPDIVQNEPTHDIAPGGNKAILTLADGSSIILDSANNGAISKQGNVTVIKLSDGQVAYKPSTFNHQPSTVQYNTISTPRGGQYQLELADGSRVWLNAASSITFPTSFVGNERDVKITGEAYFEVVHNEKMPFHVKVNDIEVQVLGTHFNINAYEDEADIKTTLLEGSVKVSKGSESVMIKPGEQAQISSGIKVIKDVDLENVMAWKNGYFILNGTSLESLMSQISRWYDVDIFYKGKIPEKKFGGSISRNVNLSTVLKALKVSGISSSLDGKKLTLSEGNVE